MKKEVRDQLNKRSSQVRGMHRFRLMSPLGSLINNHCWGGPETEPLVGIAQRAPEQSQRQDANQGPPERSTRPKASVRAFLRHKRDVCWVDESTAS